MYKTEKSAEQNFKKCIFLNAAASEEPKYFGLRQSHRESSRVLLSRAGVRSSPSGERQPDGVCV